LPPSPHEIHPQRLEQLAVFLRERDQILSDWDAYHEQHTDLDDWPYDPPSYIERAGHRDAAMWKAFNRVRPSARELLATAGMQLQRLPAKSIQPRWVWQLGVLHSALDHLAALQEEWLATRDSLPPSARPGTMLYDGERAVRNTEAMHYLDEWASAGEALLEIHRAALWAPPALTATAPVRAPAPPASTDRITKARR